jgi:ornithine lipid ester-linked acyl 2-hydroxylase
MRAASPCHRCHRCGRMAVAAGRWHIGAMRHVDRDSFLRGLAAHWRTIRDEALAIPPEDYQLWPDHAAYYGGWRVFPLRLRSWPPGLRTTFDDNRRRCPRTAALLDELGACSAVLSLMEPGARILSHRDAPDPGVMRAHLGLVCPLGAFLRVADDVVEWRDGEAMLFDGQVEHEAFNESHEARLVLLADVLVGAAR